MIKESDIKYKDKSVFNVAYTNEECKIINQKYFNELIGDKIEIRWLK